MIQSNELAASCILNARSGKQLAATLAHAPLMTDRAAFAEKKLSFVNKMNGSYQDPSLDSERRSTLTRGYVAVETGWADATESGRSPVGNRSCKNKPEALGLA